MFATDCTTSKMRRPNPLVEEFYDATEALDGPSNQEIVDLRTALISLESAMRDRDGRDNFLTDAVKELRGHSVPECGSFATGQEVRIRPAGAGVAFSSLDGVVGRLGEWNAAMKCWAVVLSPDDFHQRAGRAEHKCDEHSIVYLGPGVLEPVSSA